MTLILFIDISLFNIIFRQEPKMIGTTIKNENFAAVSLFSPKKIDIPIVAPLLEIPGNIAKAWEIPINSEFFKLSFLFKSLYLSDKNSINDVMINITPTKIKLPLNKILISFSKK